VLSRFIHIATTPAVPEHVNTGVGVLNQLWCHSTQRSISKADTKISNKSSANQAQCVTCKCTPLMLRSNTLCVCDTWLLLSSTVVHFCSSEVCSFTNECYDMLTISLLNPSFLPTSFLSLGSAYLLPFTSAPRSASTRHRLP
jgi:hypothetical protein